MEGPRHGGPQGHVVDKGAVAVFRVWYLLGDKATLGLSLEMGH